MHSRESNREKFALNYCSFSNNKDLSPSFSQIIKLITIWLKKKEVILFFQSQILKYENKYP